MGCLSRVLRGKLGEPLHHRFFPIDGLGHREYPRESIEGPFLVEGVSLEPPSKCLKFLSLVWRRNLLGSLETTVKQLT
jgi:hypothetical protein